MLQPILSPHLYNKSLCCTRIYTYATLLVLVLCCPMPVLPVAAHLTCG